MSRNWTQSRTPAFDETGARKMNEIAKTVFAPIYPVIARNAMAATGIRQASASTWAVARPCWPWPWPARHLKWTSSPSTSRRLPGHRP
ncbi:hypothetical protein [Desulfosarcina cetonica]|uniref:hypothetical protein n=1 Tax=Desulfosarcina cetonica TaxID=90730 RepID=UPI001C44A345|nr:hypothetical protein [Desulfosarcina cetonica]